MSTRWHRRAGRGGDAVVSSRCTHTRTTVACSLSPPWATCQPGMRSTPPPPAQFARSTTRPEYRLVHFNTARIAEHAFCSNKITTYLCAVPHPRCGRPSRATRARPPRRYTWYDFLPKILFEEFSKLEYFYFLARPPGGGVVRWHRSTIRGDARCIRQRSSPCGGSRIRMIPAAAIPASGLTCV